MANGVSRIGLAWLGINPGALAALSASVPSDLTRILDDPAPQHLDVIGAAAYRIAATAKPLQCGCPVAWRRWSPTRIGLMVSALDGCGWLLSVDLETVGSADGDYLSWQTTVSAGPFGQGPEGAKIDARDMTRASVARFAQPQFRMAA